MKKLLTIILAAGLILGMSGLAFSAEEEGVLEGGSEALFGEYDADDDGFLTESEYEGGFDEETRTRVGELGFDAYDYNDDGMWDENEWNAFSDDAGDKGILDF